MPAPTTSEWLDSSAFLRAHVDGAGPEDVLVTESLRLIQNGIRSIRVPHLLKCLKVSERQFERRFVRAIGVPPHQYIRIVRFREALRLLRANRFERLSDVAYDLNYVDQSHFIKDVKAFAGYTPTSLVETIRAGIDLPCAVDPRRRHMGPLPPLALVLVAPRRTVEEPVSFRAAVLRDRSGWRGGSGPAIASRRRRSARRRSPRRSGDRAGSTSTSTVRDHPAERRGSEQADGEPAGDHRRDAARRRAAARRRPWRRAPAARRSRARAAAPSSRGCRRRRPSPASAPARRTSTTSTARNRWRAVAVQATSSSVMTSRTLTSCSRVDAGDRRAHRRRQRSAASPDAGRTTR